MSTVFANGSIAIAKCDRCQRKVPYRELKPDGNSPGLRVCDLSGCYDPKDVWRLPPIQPDSLVLRFPRPDTYIGTSPVTPVGGVALDDGSGLVGLDGGTGGIGLDPPPEDYT